MPPLPRPRQRPDREAVAAAVVAAATTHDVRSAPVAGTAHSVGTYNVGGGLYGRSTAYAAVRLADGRVYRVDATCHPGVVTLRPGDRVVVRPCRRMDMAILSKRSKEGVRWDRQPGRGFWGARL